MQIISFVLNALGLLSIILASLIKGEKMKQVLFFIFLSNVLVATGYLLTGNGINGAVSGYLAGVQSIVNYLFESKNKPIPKWLISLYALSFIAANLFFGGFNFYTLLAVAACMGFIAGILQKNGRNYRLCTVGVTAIWSAYDILTRSYNGLMTHGTLFFVNLVGILIHDLKKKK